MFLWKTPQPFAFVHSFGVLYCDRLLNARVGAQVDGFCFDDLHSFIAPQITLSYLEFLYGFVCTNAATFWHRKRRIIVYSCNVYPKLFLEHFNVYFWSVQ